MEKQTLKNVDCNNNNDCNGETEYPTGIKYDFFTFVKGLMMGTADAVPGVSGGTIALIVGIYERLVKAISQVGIHFFYLLATFQIRKALNYIDFRFLACLIAGILCALAAVAGSMEYLLREQREPTLSVFFGLILASSIIVAKKLRLNDWKSLVLMVAGAVFAFWLVGQPFMAGTHTLPGLFFCGVIAICAMILPGISGSYILLILGEYVYVIGTIKTLVHQGLSGNLPQSELISCITILAVFASGCVIGLIGFSKFLRWLLSRYEHATLAILCGFMVGSLRSLWPFQRLESLPENLERYVPIAPESGSRLAIAIALALASLFLLLAIEYCADRVNRKQ